MLITLMFLLTAKVATGAPEQLQGPIRDGRVEIMRTLFALGLKPRDNDEIIRAGLESGNPAMLDLLARAVGHHLGDLCLGLMAD